MHLKKIYLRKNIHDYYVQKYKKISIYQGFL